MAEQNEPDDQLEHDVRAMLRGRVADIHPELDPVTIRTLADRPNYGRYLPMAAAAAVLFVALGIGLLISRGSGHLPIQPAGPGTLTRIGVTSPATRTTVPQPSCSATVMLLPSSLPGTAATLPPGVCLATQPPTVSTAPPMRVVISTSTP